MIFVTGTDTDVGKTLICSWLCLQYKWSYFKPIQTGVPLGRDTETVARLSGQPVFEEHAVFQAPLSPHIAASMENRTIEIQSIQIPQTDRLIVEGAGGVLVPVARDTLMIDLMQQFKLPVILVASTKLGTINHTLLSLEALKARKIAVLGVILSGPETPMTAESIATYGKIPILAEFPWMPTINQEHLRAINPPRILSQVMHEFTNYA